METVTTRKPARAMLALIALATDVPVPVDIAFYDGGHIALSLAGTTDGLLWAQRLGFGTETYINPNDGFRYLKSAIGEWHGWHISLHAHDEPPFEDDGDDLTAALTELTEATR